ncbi:hypothetical protein DRF68_06730 [Candidatus Chryseobacterium massiliae]|uniref:Uncharacterized protein n=1 Tax=Candidatus Chryseobacterium massiliense TaxID=204089 RepID=A0A3D9BDJ4_9FLAO|nr:hypothetical protein DRF68_06730 [Candidatus Chryseobacterium massiliae]
MVKRKSCLFYFSAKLQSINDKTCRFILKDAIFFKKVGNHGEKNFYGCVLMCSSAPLSARWRVWFTMICLK